MRTLFWITFLSALIVCLPHCSKSGGSGAAQPFHNVMEELTDTESALCVASNDFGFKLFKRVAKAEEPQENIFISPISLSYALGMTYNGAMGRTRDEIQTVLELSGFTQEEINIGYRHIMKLLPKVDPEVTFFMANAIWLHEWFQFELEFEDICRYYFRAESGKADFLFGLENAAYQINQWANQATKGLIPAVVSPEELDGKIWVLTNALYFKGFWTEQFKKANTTQADFFMEDGTIKKCHLMSQTKKFPYLENALFQAADLSYGQEAFSMTLILPQPDKTLDEVIDSLSWEEWNLWLSSLVKSEIRIYLPKFKFEAEYDLADIMKRMGMEISFKIGMADFSNMLVTPPTCIELVKQNTFVRVDEEGTEAAAASAVGGVPSYAPPIMRLDRPFLFVIHEKVSGTILFMGRVSEPVW